MTYSLRVRTKPSVEVRGAQIEAQRGPCDAVSSDGIRVAVSKLLASTWGDARAWEFDVWVRLAQFGRFPLPGLDLAIRMSTDLRATCGACRRLTVPSDAAPQVRFNDHVTCRWLP